LLPTAVTMKTISCTQVVTETVNKFHTCINCFQLAETSAGECGNRGMFREDAWSVILEPVTDFEELLLPFLFFRCRLACFRSSDSFFFSYLAFLLTRPKQHHGRYLCTLQYIRKQIWRGPTSFVHFVWL